MTGPIEDQLRITEIFLSLQGESSSAGWPTAFVRLTGCPLRCTYCDTAYAFSGGELMTLGDIVHKVNGYGVRHVTVTGGEPLAQPNALGLMNVLCDLNYVVSLETSGALGVSEVDARVVKVLDFKTPGSGELGRNLWSNIDHLNETDEIKFVICDRQDYDWARLKCDEHDLYDRVANVLFSPCVPDLSVRDLADWMVADRLPARLQIQLHKFIWGDDPGQ